MNDETRQSIVRRVFDEGWNSGNAAALSGVIHEDYDSNDGSFFVSDSPGGLRRLTGADALTNHIEQYAKLYDNLRFTIDTMIVDGDRVIAVWTPTGTSKDKTFTNRGGDDVPFELKGQGVSITQVVDGKVKQHDMFWARDPLFP